ncbi:MAG: hypothetical protein H3Z52_13625, partial [archaeon]|nr:hypothetical protein [archaeon]
THTIIGWVLKSDWSTFKKITYDGEDVQEEYLQLYGSMIGLIVFLPYVTFFAWNIAWSDVPSEWGTLQNIGSGSDWYGATPISYNKWLFTPNPAYQPLEELESIEIWQGQADSYYLFTYFKATNDDGDWFEFELLELTMA